MGPLLPLLLLLLAMAHADYDDVPASLPLLRLFSTEGTLRRDAAPSTRVLFDGPMRVATQLPQNCSVSVSVHGHFPLRRGLFRLRPSGAPSGSGPLLFAPGQPLRLHLARRLAPSELPPSGSPLQLTLVAQIVPNAEQKNREVLLRTEEHRLTVQLIGDDGVVEQPAKMPEATSVIQAVRDPEDCALYSVQLYKGPISAIRLIGPGAERFDLTTRPMGHSASSSSTILELRDSVKNCSSHPSTGPFLLYIGLITAPIDTQQRRQQHPLIVPLEFHDDDNNSSRDKSLPRFARPQFHVRYSPARRAFISPPLVMATELTNDQGQNLWSLGQFEFGLEAAEEANGPPIRIDPRTGALVITDTHSLGAKLQRESLEFTATILERDNGSTVVRDRATVRIELAEDAEEGMRKGSMEELEYHFEKPIYAFAVDPAEKTTQRSPDGIVIGIVSVSPQPKKNFAEDGLHMVVAEGGAGRFVLRNGTAQLLYRGPIGQFPHDYALKVLLRQRARVDTAVVHVLVSGLGSQPARFSTHFRRVLLTRDSIEPIIRAPPARDADSDARLVHALVGAACKDAQGMPVEGEECREAFVQDGRESGEWRVNVSQKVQRIAEAVLNISVRDDAHPRELPDYATVLVKFVDNNNATNNASAAGSGMPDPDFKMVRAIADAHFPEEITISDSMPADTVLASFGLVLPSHPNFSLVDVPQKLAKYLAIGKETGLLVTLRPLRGLASGTPYKIKIEAKYGQETERIPVALKIVEKSAGKGGTDVSELFYGFDPNPIGDDDEVQIRPGMELGRVMVRNSSTATDYEPIELELYPRELSERGILSIHPNGTIRLGPGVFESNSSGLLDNDDEQLQAVEMFVCAKHSTSSSQNAAFLPVHLRLPLVPAALRHPHDQQHIPLPSSPRFPQSPLVLPETTPPGSYLFSLDLPMTPHMDRWRLEYDEDDTAAPPLFALERRGNTLMARTARALRGREAVRARLLYRDGDAKNETQEIGHFTLQLLSAVPCQPRFKQDTSLRITIDQDTLLQVPDTADPWIPLGSVAYYSAELDPRARDCAPLQYELEHADELQALVRVADPQAGTLEVHTRAAAALLEPLPLVIVAHSGPTLQARRAFQLHIRRPATLHGAPLHFVGPAPLLLDIDEGAPAGTLLTTLRALGGVGIRYRNDSEDNGIQYRIVDGASTSDGLLEVDEHRGELRTLRELDFEELSGGNSGHNFVVLQFVVRAEHATSQPAELQVQLRVSDLNDNDPTFGHAQYDFVLDPEAPVGSWVGRVGARDADASDGALPTVSLLAADFIALSGTRHPIVPPALAFRLDPASGDIWLATPADHSAGSHFRLEVGAEDADGRRSARNAIVNVWICEAADLVSILVTRSMADLDWPSISAYLGVLNTRSQLRAVLHELRYAPGVRGVPGEVAARAAVLQVCMLNGTHVVPYEEAEHALRDVQLADVGIDAFEQNIFLANSRHPTAPDYPFRVRAEPGLSPLLPPALLFLGLFCAVLAILGVLFCQHRRRFMAEQRLAEAAMAIRKASNGFGDKSNSYLGAPVPLPPKLSAHFLQSPQYAELWRRPLPPAPLPADAFYSRPQSIGANSGATADYYTVQEMNINL